MQIYYLTDLEVRSPKWVSDLWICTGLKSRCQQDFVPSRGSRREPLFFKKDFIYLFLERGEGKEKERERNINVWLPLECPPPGTWPATQAWALTGNRTSGPLVQSPRAFH